MSKILVTGGAGYIGANICKVLLEKGFEVKVFDDFSNGLRKRIEKFDIEIVSGDILDRDSLLRAMSDVEAVIHLAAKKSVEESVLDPIKYFENNVSGTINVIAAMAIAKVRKIVFSSTAVVYDSASTKPLKETDRKRPISPYAESKYLGEQLLEHVRDAAGISSISLRYFNVVGSGGLGLGDNAKDNLVPKTFLALDEGRSPKVYGTDYSTRDGTCIRDYIHVVDLAEAHVLALEQLNFKIFSNVFNVGSGLGYSVFEVMHQIQETTGVKIEPQLMERRVGDPEVLIADISKIKHELGWTPRRSLREMIDSAWESNFEDRIR